MFRRQNLRARGCLSGRNYDRNFGFANCRLRLSRGCVRAPSTRTTKRFHERGLRETTVPRVCRWCINLFALRRLCLVPFPTLYEPSTSVNGRSRAHARILRTTENSFSMFFFFFFWESSILRRLNSSMFFWGNFENSEDSEKLELFNVFLRILRRRLWVLQQFFFFLPHF